MAEMIILVLKWVVAAEVVVALFLGGMVFACLYFARRIKRGHLPKGLKELGFTLPDKWRMVNDEKAK